MRSKVIVHCKYKYIICQQNSIFSKVIICFMLDPFLTLPSQPLLSSPRKLQNFTTQNESLMSVCCVCKFGISLTYVIERIESKLISACLLNDYSLIAQLHFFVYERAELSSISLECTKGKNSKFTNLMRRGGSCPLSQVL